MSAAATCAQSRDGAMTQADINRAIRSLAYLKTPDKVRAGVRNTYGVLVPLDRVRRVLSVVQAEGSFKAKVQEPLPGDAWDYDVRVSTNSRVQKVEGVATRDRPALRQREPLPTVVPMPTANPFEGPFQFKVLAASVARDFDTTAADIIGKGRARRLILPRLVMTKLCIEQGMSCSAIGIKMGGRDHSTILHQRDKFDIYVPLYPEMLASYRRHVALRDEARGVGK